MANDLSLIHHQIGNLFPKFADIDLDQFRLSDDQLNFFEEHGYVSGVKLFDHEVVQQLRSELAELVQPEHDGRELWHEYHSNESPDPSHVLFHALGAWRIQPGFHDILWNPAFLVPASQLVHGPVRFWHDQLFCKPPKHGGNVAWHQDYSYWTRTSPLAHLTCWTGLDRSTKENGCLQYIPGSHRWDLLPITGLAGDMESIREVLNEDQWAAFSNPVAIEMEIGEASFHHPLLVHGSAQNHTEIPRRAVVLNVVRDGVCSQTDDPLLDGVPAIPKGDRLDGQFFPLLFDRELVGSSSV
ncbi:MAG: phytanoyl-CoA dioxygenase family protein [Planctomycetota bacterium]